MNSALERTGVEAFGDLVFAGRNEDGSAISEPSFRRLIEHAADGVLVIDPEGAVLYANAAAAELFGCSAAELDRVLIGRPAISPDAADLVIRRPDGILRRLEMRAVDVAWHSEPALLATLRDVSSQRKLEEQYHQAQKLEAIGRLAAGVAHDFNNILAVVRAGIRMVQKQEPQLGDRSRDILQQLTERTEGGAALVRKLLSFAREEDLSPAPVDLNARIRSLTDLLGATIGARITLDLDLDDSLPPVTVDASHLEAALVNLVVNSRDAIEGQGTVTIATKRLVVANGGQEMFRLSVADTGCGMAPGVIEKAFEPFFTTKVDHGTGLGLSQVHGFVKQSGGELDIASGSGTGTTVTITLPVSGGRAGATPMARLAEPD